MSPTPSQLQESLQAAVGLLRQQQLEPALRLLTRLAGTHPQSPDVQWLLAGAHARMGNFGAAEVALRTVLVLNASHAPAHAMLGEILLRTNRGAAAEPLLRRALELNPNFPPAATNLAYVLLAQDRPDEALALLEPCLRTGLADPALLMAAGQALLGTHQPEAASRMFERLLAQVPGHPDATLGLASALVEDGRYARAAELMRPMVLGADARPEAHFVLARALAAQGDEDAAIAHLQSAVRARPDYIVAQTDLCLMTWARTGDLAAAGADLDAALHQQPGLSGLRILKAKLLENAGALHEAIDALDAGLAFGSGTLELHTAIAQVAIKCDPPVALTHAEAGLRIAPGAQPLLAAYCAALLGTNRPAEAADVAARLHQQEPTNCHYLALLASAWRALGDPRYATLYDYAFVLPQAIDVPPGWPSLAAYLAELAHDLRELHVHHAHPVNQSLRFGSQADLDFARAQSRAVRSFPIAIDGPIRRYMERLGHGTDEFRRRNTGGYRLNGAWSVRLQPRGFHVNHIHPDGWLSSACYIELPEHMDASTHAGWISFGQPGYITSPALSAERFVCPEPGLLVLFPSYMWHGTVPFEGNPDERRMTIAFDVVPTDGAATLPLMQGAETAGTSRG